MDNLERERDFYRQQCSELGARLLRLQEEQTRARRDARRSRTTATLIHKVYRLADSNVSLDEIGQRFLQVILDTLSLYRAALLYYLPEQRCFVAQHTLGFPQAEQPSFTPPSLPGVYHFVNSYSPSEPLLDCLRQAAGVPYLLWAFNRRAGLALLVGNVVEDQHLHRPFEAGDREIVEGALNVFFEITERKRAEEALRESEEKYRTLVESANEAIVIIQNEKTVYRNPVYEKLVGYSVDETIQRSFLDIVVPEDRERVHSYYLKRLQGEAVPEKYEVRLNTRHGLQMIMEVKPCLVQYHGQPATMVLMHDITERKRAEEALQKAKQELEIRVAERTIELTNTNQRLQFELSERKRAEEALRKSEERFRQVISCISDHVYMTEFTQDGQHINRYLSPNVEALTGYPHQRFLADWSFWPSTVIHPDDRAAAAAQAARFAQGQNSEMEYRLVRAEGNIIWVRDSGRVEKDPLSQSILVYGVVSDITERKRAEEILRESEERFRSVAETASDAIISIDNRGYIIFWNSSAGAIFGYSADEIIGQPLTLIMPERFHEAHQNGLKRVVSTGKSNLVGKTIELIGFRKDGREFPLELSLAAWKTGEEIFFTGIARDITERKRAEEELALARDQALEASRLKTQLLANVSHDTRTPLNAILGYAEMLQEGVYGSLSDQQGHTIAEIIDSTGQLLNFINNLLHQAQIESGKLVLKTVSFTPTDLVEDTMSTMRLLARTKDLELTGDIAPDLPPTLVGDPYWLRQILVNWINNAIKFTEQGSVHVRLYRPNETHWAMQVSDTGPGIPAEARAYIFDAFRQVDGTPTRQHAGSGLGLSIVKQLVTMMGGQIILESEAGQGSTFTAVLPLQPIQEKSI